MEGPPPEPQPAHTSTGLSGNVTLPPNIPPPPQRVKHEDVEDVSDPTHYTRDPHRLIAYLVPFPRPQVERAQQIPDRFFIYTPPPPPIEAPKEGQKEDKITKVQRKWQDEVRKAKTSDAKVTSWAGMKGRATKGINVAMKHTTSSGLDFMNRVPHGSSNSGTDSHADDGVTEGDTTQKTVGLEEMVLVHPSSLPGTEEEIRKEFVESMLRTKSKAQKDSVIATGLMPVAFGVDVLATLVWPFGGLVEIDAVWGYNSMRGAKTARSVSKRLQSSGADQDDGKKLRLTFKPSPRTEILRKYLAWQCHHKDDRLFKSDGPIPTETDVLNAIGWTPSTHEGETKNWEDEQWELQEVKEDMKSTMKKAASEWDKWCKTFEKDPEKALKKG